MTRGTALLVFALLPATSATAIEVSVPSSSIRVGDLVSVELSVAVPAGAEPEFPQWSDTWGEAEIREIGPVETEATVDGGLRAKQRLLITFFRSGEVVLPSPMATISDSTETSGQREPESITFHVESVLPEGEEIPEPKPPTAPLELAWGRPFAWTTSLLVLACLVVFVLLLRQRRSLEVASRAVPVDPLAALRLALGQLPADGELEEMFTAVSLQLRYFFARTLAFPAAESTTSEIRLRLRDRDLPSNLIQRSDELLRQCDGIKFARREATTADFERGLRQAEGIGAETTDFIVQASNEEKGQEAT